MRVVLALVVVLVAVAPARADRAINVVIGDASWAGHVEPADEVTRIRAHLSFVHAMLAGRDVSSLTPAQRDARAASLADLARYIDRGVFPRRTGDDYTGRRPRFIDDRGVHCAVGQLIADSGDEDLARSINTRFEYAHVRAMTEPALLAWASAHGFTVDELAMIQPSYSSLPTRESVREMIVEAKDAIALRCARKHAPMDDLLVIAINDDDGATRVRTKSTEPFALCFVNEASQLARGGEAWDGAPEEFQVGIDLSLPSPQEQLERRIATWKSYCNPRPGALAREATVQVWSTKDVLAFDIATSPANPLVENCMKEAASRTFRDFAPGPWNLYAKKTIALEPHVRFDARAFESHVGRAATECNPSPAPRAKSTITMTAKPNDPRFTIMATGSPAFSTCMSDRLNARFLDAFRIRYVFDGRQFELFRIDTDVNMSVTIEIEPAASRMRREKREQERIDARRGEPDV